MGGRRGYHQHDPQAWQRVRLRVRRVTKIQRVPGISKSWAG